MATLDFSGFETGDTSDARATSGTFSVQNSVTSGAWSAYAFRANPTTTAVGRITFGQSGVTGVAGSMTAVRPRVRFYFRYDTAPASGDEELFILARGTTTSASPRLSLRLNSSGQLVAYNENLALVTTGATTLTASVFYCIQVDLNTTDGSFSVYLNGALELTGSITAANGTIVSLTFGKGTNRNGNSVDFYFDDARWSDSTLPGPGRCGILIPNANGNYTGNWTIGAGSGSSFQVVDEVPHNSDTDYLVSDLNTAHAETEAMQDSSTLSISGTINCVKPCIVVKRDGASNGSIKLRHRSGSTDTDLLAFTTTTSYTLIAGLYDTDPATAIAWTTGGIDGIEVGALEQSAANKTRMTAAYLMVDWSPAGYPYRPPDASVMCTLLALS